jgi:hypothetical protein
LNGGLFSGGDAYNMYFVGGGDHPYTTTADKIGVSTMTMTTISGALPQALAWTSGMNNNGVAGYTGNGYAGGSHDNISKLLYATDTNVNLSDNANAYYGLGSTSQTGVAGYMFGGDTSTNDVNKDARKITFSNDTQSTIEDVFTTEGGISSCYVGDAAASSVNSYYGGGIRSTATARIDKFPFATETPTALSNEMTCDSYYTRATEDYNTSCWYFPGNACTTVVNKMPISNETPAAVSSGLSVGRYFMGVIGVKGVAVYAAEASATTMDKWDVSNDTRSSVAGSAKDNGPSTFANQDLS